MNIKIRFLKRWPPDGGFLFLKKMSERTPTSIAAIIAEIEHNQLIGIDGEKRVTSTPSFETSYSMRDEDAAREEATVGHVVVYFNGANNKSSSL